jgi:hypothetical protein
MGDRSGSFPGCTQGQKCAEKTRVGFDLFSSYVGDEQRPRERVAHVFQLLMTHDQK